MAKDKKVYNFGLICISQTSDYNLRLQHILPVTVNFSVVMTTSSSLAVNSSLSPPLLRTSNLRHWASTASGPAERDNQTLELLAFNQKKQKPTTQ